MNEVVPLNSTPILKALFLNDQGNPATPTTITLTIIRPNGTTIVKTQADVNVVGAGHIEYAQPVDFVGVWIYTYDGQGNGVDASQTEYLLVGVEVSGGPCDDWMMPDDLFACGKCASVLEVDRDHALAERMITAATEFYWTHSGRQFSGFCDVTVRPCCHPYEWSDDVTGTVPTGHTYSTAWPRHARMYRRSCGCPDVSMLRLPGPVRGVISVYENGALLTPAAYRIEQTKWLVRLDGQFWQSCQDMHANPLTDQHTLQIRYIKGTPPPQLGVEAVQELACELYRGCAVDADCAVPSRVVNIARQGVSMQLVTPEQIGIGFDGRVRTGLKTGALFLATYPGNKGRARNGIASPDIVPAVRRVS